MGRNVCLAGALINLKYLVKLELELDPRRSIGVDDMPLASEIGRKGRQCAHPCCSECLAVTISGKHNISKILLKCILPTTYTFTFSTEELVSCNTQRELSLVHVRAPESFLRDMVEGLSSNTSLKALNLVEENRRDTEINVQWLEGLVPSVQGRRSMEWLHVNVP